ncbi:MAG: DNA mismatch repair protein MutL, partial [Clostridium sp.]|nr:DNA mismatch repair protein MutL [Clostridium sp.]
IRDGKQELLTPGDGQLRSAVYAVLGRELALGFREVKATGEDMTVTGFVSLPACCRGSRNYQFFFVNGRQVKSRLMMAALEEAYQNQKMVGKFPGCVLHLETKLNAVDVNVHPAKTEVKFGNERQVFSSVYHAVLSALEGDKSHPAMTVRPADKPRTTVNILDSVTPNQTKIQANITRLYEKKEAQTTVHTSLSVNDITKKTAAPVVEPRVAPSVTAFGGDSSPLKGEPGLSKNSHEKKTCLPLQGGGARRAEGAVRNSEPAPRPEPVIADQPGPSEPVCKPVWESGPEPEAPAWRMAGEVLNTYIVVEQGESVFFIDKHAAHERMNFDRMKAQNYEPMTQALLTPVICRLGEQEREVLLEQRELLERFGFDVEELGGSIAVRQAPFDVDIGQVEETLAEIARKLLTGARVDPAAARDEVLHTMACKAAIKGGWHTSEKELERVAQAVMSGQVKYCPHGRPVAIELTKKELEKQFKRA